jgi:uncharacterized membrane protein YhaH (DUF805 family)
MEEYKKYFSFLGESSRSEYWSVIGIVVVALLVSLVIMEDSALGALLALVSLVGSLWLYLATTVRRLRDAGLHPIFLVATVLPYVSAIAVVIFGALPPVKKDENF